MNMHQGGVRFVRMCVCVRCQDVGVRSPEGCGRALAVIMCVLPIYLHVCPILGHPQRRRRTRRHHLLRPSARSRPACSRSTAPRALTSSPRVRRLPRPARDRAPVPRMRVPSRRCGPLGLLRARSEGSWRVPSELAHQVLAGCRTPTFRGTAPLERRPHRAEPPGEAGHRMGPGKAHACPATSRGASPGRAPLSLGSRNARGQHIPRHRGPNSFSGRFSKGASTSVNRSACDVTSAAELAEESLVAAAMARVGHGCESRALPHDSRGR